MNGFKDASIGQIVKRLIASLGDKDYRWIIGGLCNLGEMHAAYSSLGAQVVDFSGDGAGSSARRIRSFLADNPVQIIHTHTMRTILAAWQALGGAAPVRTLHLATKHTLTRPMDRPWGAFYTLADRLTLYMPDRLVPVGFVMEKQILALPGIRPDRVCTVPNGISCQEWYTPGERTRFRQALQLDPHQPVIGFGGRLEQVKRLDLLLEAFAGLYPSHPQARLLLAGEGSLRAQLEKQARQAGIAPALTWTGFCQEMPAFLAALDIYVQPSLNEGMPLSVLEAMAAGKAIVATRVGGNAEVIEHGASGLLVPPGSAQAIQAALLELIEQPQKRQALAQTALRQVRERYDLGVMVDGYRRLYQKAAG
jgi:glycosyltransferase involved in cell wall biosynthesis